MPKKVVVSKKPDLNQPLDAAVIGQYLRHRRTALSMTLEDAASLCGLSKKAYGNVELGVSSVQIDTVFKALNGMGITLTLHGDSSDEDDWS